MKHVIIGTAGHVDHGKTVLVKALTGTDTDRLAEEKRLDVLAALLSGDQKTFELFRCEAPELMHLPEATFDWYCRNYLDRDYPLRMILRLNGVEFPEKLE